MSPDDIGKRLRSLQESGLLRYHIAQFLLILQFLISLKLAKTNGFTILILKADACYEHGSQITGNLALLILNIKLVKGFPFQGFYP